MEAIIILFSLIASSAGYIIGRTGHIFWGHLKTPHHWIYGLFLIVIGIIFLAAVGSSSAGLPFRIPGLSLGFAFLGSPMFALPAGIAGLILGILAVRKKSKRGIAIAGIVLNAIVVLWFVAVLTMWGMIGD